MQLGARGRPPAPLTGDNLELVRPVRVAADQDRLQDALRLDRFRERIDRRLVEVVTRLESAWAQVLDGHGLARADLVERGVVLVLLAEEGGETAAEIGALALVRWWPVNHGKSRPLPRSEEHTSELQSLMRISYAVFCLKKQKHKPTTDTYSMN